MSYLSKVKLISESGETVVPKSAKENSIRVLAYDVETGAIVKTLVKEVRGTLLNNKHYISSVSPLGGRNRSLELTLDHYVLAEVGNELKYLLISEVMVLVDNGVEVRFLSLNRDSLTVSASGNVLSKGDLFMTFPATFVEDISLEKTTYVPIVSFDSGRTNFVM